MGREAVTAVTKRSILCSAVSEICGFVFGLGLLISGMVQLTKVLGFL
jgi:hypothetical protein